MKVITALQDLGYRITIDGENIRLKPLSGISPDRTVAQALIGELKTRKQEALDYLSTQDATRTAQTKYCSWREMAVPAEECVKPCYIYKGKECKHLIIWWEERLKWLQDNNPEVLTLPQRVGTIPDKNLSPGDDSFDPDGALASLLECAKRKGISDAQVASIVDDLIRAKSLKAPWGIRIKNSPIMGDYWIVSDDQAKRLVRTQDVIFTQEDIRLLADVKEIFGPRVVEVKK